MSKKLTPWFPAKVKPVHVGVYQTIQSHFPGSKTFYQFWDGQRWGFSGHTANEAFEDKRVKSFYQDGDWRGLAEKP